MRAMRLLLGLLGLLASVPLAVPACLWDRDTFDQEASRQMDVVTTATGNFDGLPRRYYEMRAARLPAKYVALR